MYTGLNKWKYDPKVESSWMAHGLSYDNGVIYASTGPNNTVVALNAETARRNGNRLPCSLWKGHILTSPPLIWKYYVIAGPAIGDIHLKGTNAPVAKGTVTALNEKTGKIVWQINTTVGDWVEGEKANINGGATVWSEGAIDTEKGIVNLPCSNTTHDFDASSRPEDGTG